MSVTSLHGFHTQNVVVDQFAMQDDSGNYVLPRQRPHHFQLERNRGQNPSIDSSSNYVQSHFLSQAP